jgi:hypothetical protein
MTRSITITILALALAACGGNGGPGEGAVGVVATALNSTCEAGTAPQTAVDRVEVLVTGADRDTGLTVVLAKGNSKITASTQDVALGSVPAGLDNVVTVLGYAPGQQDPSWFGRRREVAIAQDRTTEVEMVLTRFGAFTCLDSPASLGQRAFPASVVLGDGRVLVSGGFTTASDNGSGKWTLSGASKTAYLYDPGTGQFTEAGAMTEARAGHAMVYLPLAGGEKVLVFGGTSKVTWTPGTAFPLDMATSDALNSYEVYDVAKGTFEAAGTDQLGNPKQMVLRRAFLQAVRLFDNSVLITGGGRWPSDASNYDLVEMWAPYGDKDADGKNPRGGLLDLKGSLKTNRQHTGAALVKLEDTSQGLSRYLVVGGTTAADATVEIFTQSSKQEDGAGAVFRSRAVSGLPLLYFPSVIPLQENADGSKPFLVAGGLPWSGTALSVPQSKAWILTVDTADKITVEALDAPCAARFLHSATASYDGDGAVLLGGFGDFGGAASGGACFFDLATKSFSTPSAGQPQFYARGGHAAERLVDDTLLVVGGLVDPAGLADGSAGLLELYAPPVLKTNLAQAQD